MHVDEYVNWVEFRILQPSMFSKFESFEYWGIELIIFEWF